MAEQRFEMGMIGLGVMGRNLVLNIADHGYSVLGFDKDTDKVKALQTEAQGPKVQGADSLENFIRLLKQPRLVMMLVPAGSPVDSVIWEVLPHLNRGDTIIDGGNSYFKDTDLRAKTLADKGIDYLGVGISGGESGARHGPSMMPGGPRSAYERVQPIFEAIAAHVKGEPCVTYLGPGSAGHYVKMVHNGIEYGLMQLIAETYDLMKRGLSLSDDELHQVFSQWNETELRSYLLEITGDIFSQQDKHTNRRLIDVILDEAKQKGTGMWTSQSGMELHQPIPTIDLAVAIRDLSVLKDEREAAGQIIKGPPHHFVGNSHLFIKELRNAFYAGMVLTFAQGMALLRQASAAYDYHLPLADVARIWRGGCIIRAALLEDIYATYRDQPDLANLLLNPKMAQAVMDRQENLRNIVHYATSLGLPVPGLMASLAYLDAYRSAWLPANLIQAQRDYFGAHTYERIDEKGTFHTQWNHTEEE
jgi:6-phosphogluconate dehydrogenase